MPLSEWFRGRSALERALQRGIQPDADLVQELRDLGDVEVKTAREANAICDALERVRDGKVPVKRSFNSPLHALTALFQAVQDPEAGALPVLRNRGTALLCEIADRGLDDRKVFSDDDLLFVLKVLAHYGTRAGTARVIKAGQAGFKSDGYMWSVTLSAYTHEHPHTATLFSALKDPLPQAFLAVSLADAANTACRENASIAHPFDSAAGATRLRQWLTDANEDRFSYAISAVAALPFLRQTSIEPLLELALAHPHAPVRLEAAWAEARMKRRGGIERLAKFSLDVNHSATARHYLDELGAADAVPAEALTPDFKARSEFAQWLAHPSELGRAPDAVEIVDRRELRWPPDFERKPVWLIRYQLKHDNGLDEDDRDVGMVGSTTFCLFSYQLDQRPSEDGYAIHCAWEMEMEDLLKIEEVEEGISAAE